jgi:hypothetical protein
MAKHIKQFKTLSAKKLNLKEAFTPASQKDYLTSFQLELLSIDKRILIHSIHGNVDKDKGYFVNKNNIHIPFGLPAMSHQISHMVEMKNKHRLLLPDWGMPAFVGDKPNNKTFYAALSREIRVRAIDCVQNPLIQKHDTRFNIFENSVWKDWAIESLPFGRFKTFEDINLWMCDLRDKTIQAWNLDRIKETWISQLAYIQHWMESDSHSLVA